MNSNAAVFGICNPESGYGSSQSYPTSEQLSAFYGSASSGGGGSGGTSSGGGGGSSGAEPSSPSPYAGLHSERHHPPETKYEPNPSHSPSGQSGIISSDNGLQYANLDGSASDLKGYGSGYPSGHPHQASYQAHHASLVQASYAHHYGKGFVSLVRTPSKDFIRKLIINLIFFFSPFEISQIFSMPKVQQSELIGILDILHGNVFKMLGRDSQLSRYTNSSDSSIC